MADQPEDASASANTSSHQDQLQTQQLSNTQFSQLLAAIGDLKRSTEAQFRSVRDSLATTDAHIDDMSVRIGILERPRDAEAPSPETLRPQEQLRQLPIESTRYTPQDARSGSSEPQSATTRVLPPHMAKPELSFSCLSTIPEADTADRTLSQQLSDPAIPESDRIKLLEQDFIDNASARKVENDSLWRAAYSIVRRDHPDASKPEMFRKVKTVVDEQVLKASATPAPVLQPFVPRKNGSDTNDRLISFSGLQRITPLAEDTWDSWSNDLWSYLGANLVARSMLFEDAKLGYDERLDNELGGLLGLTVNNHYKNTTLALLRQQKITSGMVIYKRLKADVNRDSASRRSLLRQKMLVTVQKSNESVQDYADRHQEIFSQLGNIDETLKENEKVEVFLKGLNPSFAGIKEALYTSEFASDTKKTFTEAVNFLLTIEEKRNLRSLTAPAQPLHRFSARQAMVDDDLAALISLDEMSEEDAVAYVAKFHRFRGNPRPGPGSTSPAGRPRDGDWFPGECDFCHNVGHRRIHCRLRARLLDGSGPGPHYESKPNAKVAISDETTMIEEVDARMAQIFPGGDVPVPMSGASRVLSAKLEKELGAELDPAPTNPAQPPDKHFLRSSCACKPGEHPLLLRTAGYDQASTSPAPCECSHGTAGRETGQDRAFRVSSAHPPTTCQDGDSTLSSAGRALLAWPDCEDNVELEEERWILDSGATHHMTASVSLMQRWAAPTRPVHVRVANGKTVPATRVGSVDAQVRGQDRPCGLPLRDVLLVPELDANLLSTHQLSKQGFITIILRSSTILIFPSGRALPARIDPKNGAAYFLIRASKPTADDDDAQARAVIADTGSGASTANAKDTLDPRVLLWHRRAAHVGWEKLRQWVELGLLVGRDAPTTTSLKKQLKDGHVCDVCVTANQRRAPYPDRAPSRASNPNQLVHSDIIGPFVGNRNFAWILTLVDDCTRKVWIYCLPDRTAETLTTTFDAWAQQVEVAIGQPVASIHTDNGKEFVADQLQSWAKERGTAWTWTAPYSSSQNGIAERRNGLIEERMRAMLRDSRLPFGFWPYAAQYAAFILNRTPSKSIDGKTPQLLWSGKPPDLTVLRVFGCLCWTLIYPEQRQEGKLSARGLRGIFLGVGEERRAWLVYCPSSPSNPLRWSRSMVFDETRTYNQSLPLEVSEPVERRQDDHVEMQLNLPTVRRKKKNQPPPQGEQAADLVPTGGPTDEDLHLQEFEPDGGIQTLEPPSAVLPPADVDDQIEDLAMRHREAAEHGDLPLWEPTLTAADTTPVPEMQAQIKELERQWASDESSPSSIMSLDDLGALLDETLEPQVPRSSTPPPASSSAPLNTTTIAKPTPVQASGILRRSSRLRNAGARQSRRITEEMRRAEIEDDERIAIATRVNALSAAVMLGMTLDWASSSSAYTAETDEAKSPLEPQNLKQARARSDWPKWRQAMDEEIDSLAEMGTWSLVAPPTGYNIVGSRWVYKLKLGPDGEVVRYKARLVAQGFTQREGIDFKETFAPVARLGTIRLIISLALALGLRLGSVDIKTAYLNGTLYEEVYMQQPPEFDDGSGRVCLLRRAIYGLRQAGRAWFDTLKGKLVGAGFIQIEGEPCLFVRFDKDGPVILAVYVDDIIIAAHGEDGVTKVKREIGSWYKLTDNGDLSFILGVKVDYSPEKRTAHLSQGAYIDGLLQKYGMENESPLPTPMTESARKLGPNTSGQASKTDVHDYAALIGSLLWAAQGTRPDIAFPVGHLARFISNPSPAHFLAAKRVLRYLKGTKDHGLTYRGGSQVPVAGWSDSDHATDPSTRRSVSGYVFHVYGNAVSWRSRLQSTVAISSTEAEYVALSEASREAKWIRTVLGELRITLHRASDILTDSKGAEAIARDPADHPKTKHMEVHHHFVRLLQQRKEVCIGRVHTDSNPADMLTKALPATKLGQLSSIIGIKPAESVQEGVKARRLGASGGSVGSTVLHPHGRPG